jgi:uncharacterized damage-inducible protein DinB
MKELLLRAARYNAWANEQFIQLLLTLDDESWTGKCPAPFPR